MVAPGLTVRSRLQTLIPDNSAGNCYDEFNVVPATLVEKLRQDSIRVRNCHVLNWETDEQVTNKRSLDKRVAKSDVGHHVATAWPA